MDKMTREKYIEFMINFFTENHVQLLIDMPAGTLEPKLIDNMHLGGAVQFYILRAAIPAAFRALLEDVDVEADERAIDATLALVKKELMEVIEERKKSP